MYPAQRKMVPIKERLFSKVSRMRGGCWLWKERTDRKGYGRLGVWKRGMQQAHRVSWEIHFGKIPDGLCVLHKCDVPACVRPDHLFLGTRIDNNIDMRRKCRDRYASGDESGRRKHPELWPRGNQIHCAKLTEDKVRALRDEYAAGGISFAKLGIKYGIGHTTVENIVKRRKWAHVS